MKNLENINYEFNKDVMLRTTEKTTLVYNPETSDMYELNEVGADIFNVMKESDNMKEVFDKLCSIYTATKEEIYNDVDVFVTRMFELGIVTKNN